MRRRIAVFYDYLSRKWVLDEIINMHNTHSYTFSSRTDIEVYDTLL